MPVFCLLLPVTGDIDWPCFGLGIRQKLTLRVDCQDAETFSGPVAQVVEQLTFNQWVEGSNPSGLTIFFLH